jgi:hypothetical protein
MTKSQLATLRRLKHGPPLPRSVSDSARTVSYQACRSLLRAGLVRHVGSYSAVELTELGRAALAALAAECAERAD